MSVTQRSKAMSCSRRQSEFKDLREAADMSEAGERQEGCMGRGTGGAGDAHFYG